MKRTVGFVIALGATMPLLLYSLSPQGYRNTPGKSSPPVPKDIVGCYNYDAYLAYAQMFADTLLQTALDKYGRVSTPMFLQVLSLKTHKPATKKDDPNWQQRYDAEDYMKAAQGSNLYRDIHTIKALRELTRLTKNPKYAQSADAYLGYFLKHCVSTTTGLFAWGEHMYYDVFLDTVVAHRHEMEIPLPPWEELWRIDSTAVKNEIEAIYKYHIYDKEMFWYDRHGNYYTGQFDEPAVRGTWIKHSGLYTYSFIFLYTKTHNPEYLTWAKKMADVFYAIRDPKTDGTEFRTGWQYGG